MGEGFIPFGAQYYRAPTPLCSDWDKDLKSFAEYGFNTIKIWTQWRWNCPRENGYYFDDIDKLMDLAAGYGLKVIINTIFDVAPAWFFKKYPESVMLTCDGRRVEPQARDCRQIGGAPGPCYNHQEGIRLRLEFLSQVVERYKNHPALYIWDLWNEPELTCGLLREPVQADMVCYCDNCREGFIAWLRGKYGDIDGLNRAWNRNYTNWDETELPRNGDIYNDMIDWRMYFSHVLTEELRLRAETVKKLDRRTPVMVHTVPIPYFNMINACNNDYELAKLCDLFGNSSGSLPFPAAFNTSCAEGKRVINAEIHALGGDTYNRPLIPSFEDIKGHVLIPLARGIKGFIYWQYRAEILGREGPAWGLTTLDGEPTDWLRYNVRINKALQDNAALIESVKPMPSQIAVLNSYKNQVFDWCASDSTDLYCSSVIGAYTAMYHSNLNADVLGLEQVCREKLGRYRVIYCPFPYYLDSRTADLLKEWVAEGGCLISEAFFGAVSEDDGLHSRTVPGFDFSRVFGVKEDIAVTASIFTNAYGREWFEKSDKKYVQITMSEDVGKVKKGDGLGGFYFMERLLPMGAEILGTFEDGAAAVTAYRYGKGKAIMVGSLLGYAYAKASSGRVADLIAGMAAMGEVDCPVTVEGGRVRADLLKNETDGAVLVVNSFDKEDTDLNINISAAGSGRTWIVNLISGERIPLAPDSGGYLLNMRVGAGAHEIYQIV